MRDAQKPDHVSLNTLIGRLREGRFVIPDFQREFEWNPWDICELMRSIFLDYYIGSLLLWKGKKENFDALCCEAVYGHTGPSKPEYIVLDGQQRLTAIHYAFLGPDTPLPNKKNRAIYYVQVDKFMAEVYDEAFDYEWHSKRIAKLLEKPELQFEAHFFPCSIVGKGGWALGNWMQQYAKYWSDAAIAAKEASDVGRENLARANAENAVEFGEHMRGITEQYQISHIELDQDLGVDKVCDIFTQINSRGVRLDVFDLVNALLKPKGLQLKHLWRDAAPRLEFVETEKMNVYILQVMSILRQAYCSPKYLYFLLPGQEKPVRDPDGTRRKEVLITSIDEFKKRWHEAVAALDQAIKLIRHPQELGVSSSKYLPYVSILPVFSALQAQAKARPAATQLDAQRKIRHWYWASVFTNRYSGSIESTSARDFLDVKAWLESSAPEPSLIEEFKSRFRQLDLRKEVKRGTSVYNGIFNLLILAGARDWITGKIPQHDDLDDHHIVPASWGTTNLKGNLIHSILNRTPLTSETNRHIISDKLPNAYLPELIRTSGEEEVVGILASHFISRDALSILLRDPFTPDDFEAFLAERQSTIVHAIENLLIKERLDLTPDLRKLDENIEQVELKLRRTVGREVETSASLLPQHVVQKVDERIQRALKKNAGLDAEYYQTVSGKLEYFDLRELQDVITAKTLWSKFESKFANKETLVGKFDQLAELRNGIRHSRTVNDVTRKEGEAAIIWFQQILGKAA